MSRLPSWSVGSLSNGSWLWAVVPVALAIGSAAGCSSNSPATSDGGAGGPVTGELDTHCTGTTPITVSAASCTIPPDPDAGTGPEFGDPIYNAEADDDDCKYHVKFTVTPQAIKVGATITFKVTVTYKATGAPASGAVNAAGDGIFIESYVSDMPTHVLPNPAPVFAETPSGSGVYTATAKFDVSGRWVVRFHLFGNCLDGAEDSPHGHVAFFFDVVP
jgi:hypothetical protein